MVVASADISSFCGGTGTRSASSVADIAAYTWAAPYNLFEMNLDEFPHVERWLEAVASRPATERAYAIAKEMNPQAPQPVRRAQRQAAKLAT